MPHGLFVDVSPRAVLRRHLAGALGHLVRHRRRHARAWALAALALTVAAACQDVVTVPPARRVLSTRPHFSVSPAYTPQCTEEQFPPQPATSAYGINVNKLYHYAPNDSTPDASYRPIATALREANLGWVRLDFDWGRLIATQSSQRDTGQIDWSGMDRDVSRAVCRGLNVVGDLAYTPAWAVNTVYDTLWLSGPQGTWSPVLVQPNPGVKNRLLPDSLRWWAAFVRAAVTRYPQIRYWSVWNEPDSRTYFLGFSASPSDTAVSRVAMAYDSLIVYAAPWIRSNPDGQGRRYLVGPELGGAGDPTRGEPFLRRVLTDQGRNIDVVAVHHYSDPAGAAGIVSYMKGLTTSASLTAAGWTGDVWLTEVGLNGCNDYPANVRSTLSYCDDPKHGHIDDAYQASHLNTIIGGMQGAPASARWTKTFYWHSHLEVFADTIGNNSGILSGAHAGVITGRPAYTTYAGFAGPLTVGGGAYGSNQNVPVTATPAVAAPAGGPYYYVWEYMWCYNGNAPGDCDHLWHPYASGTMSTVSPYVNKQDFYVNVRVRQYGWQNGPQIGSGEWDISGPGTCTDPRGCPGPQSVSAGTAGGTALNGGSSPDPSAERRKGIGHAGNR